ncbi:unnamed protein product [Sympodiomycopsis kandeliae]
MSSAIPQLDFLKKVVTVSKHEDVQEGGSTSLVYFRTISQPIQEVTQDELRHLWSCGEGLKGGPNQPKWDLLIPVRFEDYFSIIIVQVKNRVGGQGWTGQRGMEDFLPVEGEGGEDHQKIFLWLELNAARFKADSSQA